MRWAPFATMSLMTTVREILAALEGIAPERYAMGFDRVGLQVGSLDQAVTRAVVSLDRSLGAVRFAKEIGAEFLLAHHPLIFTPLATVDTRTHEGRTVMKLIQQGMSFAAAHTNWDAAIGGINDTLAELFGLTDVSAFGMVSETGEQKLGRVGTLASPTTLTELAGHADRLLETRCWAWGDPTATITKVAIVGGAGDSEWAEAQRAGADVLLTGEVKQHIAVEASESGMALIAAGHYQTEHPGCAALRDRMAAASCRVDWVLYVPPVLSRAGWGSLIHW